MDDPRQHILSIGQARVLFVMATTHEYGPALRARINPLISGVGPVEAAVATATALARLDHAGQLPDLVFTLGSAGSRRLDHAGIYQMASVSYRDMDASPLGFEKGVTPFLDEPAHTPITYRIEGVPAASLATGASIVSGASYEAIDADMVDMESYAVLRAARRFGLPTIGLRGISDGRRELGGFEDWTEYLQVIDHKLASALDVFSRQVGESSIGNGTFS
ncbi:5'-methylthioadenosine/S-adenosylhomocysteine nucleosidase [Ancylobacter defluvii]|uniref:5'-methylthioadenosine/S-adenosylhomocysteine nucleosidase n=1 Tax=Ancylobacter defluvii TaxID=1282440 RepID=A0A9W6JUZ5_9HYPH|nr:5'-methylthioadenosine/S-adenosylhomocysteine nucleosidase [Ancylobacter defluvii]MBS7589918.1 5'-methylthioadenosine/S-adenosylhomocysteine nucleosidase [Ancylobacter defluvii]GLK83043.1 5'-methylthioadenosine/S-adenosylhomocysteine nucleosidase [Ancylobacter defluvii]